MALVDPDGDNGAIVAIDSGETPPMTIAKPAGRRPPGPPETMEL